MTDDELREGLARNLDSGFEQLVLAYQRRLYTFALRYGGCTQDAEEVVQDAFVRAYRALVTYPPEQVRVLALRPWLFQITVNVARNRVRGKRVATVPFDGIEGWAEPPVDHKEQPEALLEQTERGAELGALVAALPERYRAAVILRHINELSYNEAAALLGQPVGTVKSDVHRGVGLLRAAVMKQLSEVG
jgi:RNA polymerase sigma-70 factor (ECF subfamily)